MNEEKLSVKEKIEYYDLEISSFQQDAKSFYDRYLGPKGAVKEIFGLMKDVPAEQRVATATSINEFKQRLEHRYDELKKIVIQPEEKKKILPYVGIPRMPVKAPKEVVAQPIETKIKKDPKYAPEQKIWIIMNEKAIEVSIGCVRTEETAREFMIYYDCYYNLSDFGIDSNGSPSKGRVTRKEDQKIFETKEALLASL